MTLKDNINQQIKDAMKRKDEAALRALRAIKSAILLEETAEGRSGGLTPEDEIRLLTRQVKQRRDSAEQFKANGRDDLAQTELAELVIIEAFLPKALTEDEIKAELQALMTELGIAKPSAPADFGKLMKAATLRMAGKADGKVVSALAKEALA